MTIDDDDYDDDCSHDVCANKEQYLPSHLVDEISDEDSHQHIHRTHTSSTNDALGKSRQPEDGSRVEDHRVDTSHGLEEHQSETDGHALAIAEYLWGEGWMNRSNYSDGGGGDDDDDDRR